MKLKGKKWVSECEERSGWRWREVGFVVRAEEGEREYVRIIVVESEKKNERGHWMKLISDKAVVANHCEIRSMATIAADIVTTLKYY